MPHKWTTKAQSWDAAVVNAKAISEGGKMAEHGVNQYTGGDNNVMSSRQGNDQTYTLRRLHRDHSDLFERVKAGELSPNAAAIQAGFRSAPVTITARSSPDAAAQRIRERLGDEFAYELGRVLFQQQH